jgi:predicted MFS family arabinose efflux permease
MCRCELLLSTLIHSIQQDFAVTQAQAALTVTFAQVSYALGLLFIVPMGDIVNKAKAIPFLMVLVQLAYLPLLLLLTYLCSGSVQF